MEADCRKAIIRSAMGAAAWGRKPQVGGGEIMLSAEGATYKHRGGASFIMPRLQRSDGFSIFFMGLTPHA